MFSDSNPVGRGRYGARHNFGGGGRALVPWLVKLPWIPTEQQWLDVLAVFRDESIRNRLMLALANDAALRREELCSLRTDDLDPAHRMVRVRAETTKTRRGRSVPYSAYGALLAGYLDHRGTISRSRGPLFLVGVPQRRRAAQLVDLVEGRASGGACCRRPTVSTHTTRHLCLTDLARMGWALHMIATFAGHASTDSTLRYIHLSGRDLSDKLNRGMAEFHAWRISLLTAEGTEGVER